MKFYTLPPVKMLLLCIVLIFQFSCSKDSDLLAELVISETQEALDINEFIVDDIFFIASSGSITLDVLANDTFENEEEVLIVETSSPSNGTVEINNDNTLTYTPEETSTTTTSDTFTYTTEVVSEDASVSVETGNVIVTTGNRATTGDNIFYVTTTGKANNDGSTEANAWNLTHAFATAVAGDIVYVKAGNYGATYLTTTRGGSTGNPIVFFGYTTTPGDIEATAGPTYTKDDWVSNGQNLPDTVMPHLEATATNDVPTDSEVAFTLNHDYIELHNFMISRHWSGIKVNGDNIVLDNIIGYRFGNWSASSNCWNLGSAFNCDNATGYGIYSTLGSNTSGLTIRNSIIIDAGLAAFFPVSADNVLIEWCDGIAYNAGNGTDYIFDFFATTNSTVRDCYAERTYNITGTGRHASRSIILQAGSDFNTVERLTSVNLRAQLEYASNNVLRDIKCTTTFNGINDNGLQVYAQSDNNTFSNWEIIGGNGVQFLGDVILDITPPTYTSSGDNNYFINFIIRDIPNIIGNAAISFHRFMDDGKARRGNFIGLTVNNVPRIFNANEAGDVNIYNSTFSNIFVEWDGIYTGATWGDDRATYSANFFNCNFDNTTNAFADPTDDLNAFSSITNEYNFAPLFTNATAGDFTQTSGSPLKNVGMNSSTLHAEAAKDFLGNTRVLPYDIGAYEN